MGGQGDVPMTQRYPKPWQSYQEQLELPMVRGMVVTDQPKALEYLERIGYYRLSGYWFAFRERTELCCPLYHQGNQKLSRTKPTRLPLDNFKLGTTFQNAVDLYVFDKKLRLLAAQPELSTQRVRPSQSPVEPKHRRPTETATSTAGPLTVRLPR